MTRTERLMCQSGELEHYLTEQQVVEITHTSRSTLKKFRCREEDPLPYLRIGRRYLYDRKALDLWMRRQASQTRILLDQRGKSHKSKANLRKGPVVFESPSHKTTFHFD